MKREILAYPRALGQGGRRGPAKKKAVEKSGNGESSPAQSGRDTGEDGLDYVRVVLDAELIGYGQE